MPVIRMVRLTQKGNGRDYMTESEFNESALAVFTHVEQVITTRAVAIKHTLNNAALKLEFADGQRIILARDTQAQTISLASKSGSTEYKYINGDWVAQINESALRADFAQLLERVVNSNPINAQPGRLNKTPLLSVQTVDSVSQQSSAPIKTILLLSVLAWLGYTTFQHYSNSDVQTIAPMARPASLPDNKCDASLPQNGATYIFPVSNIQPDNPLNTEVTLQNDHSYPLLATFTAPNTVIPYFSVMVYAGRETTIALPTGQYDLLFSVGDPWCS